MTYGLDEVTLLVARRLIEDGLDLVAHAADADLGGHCSAFVEGPSARMSTSSMVGIDSRLISEMEKTREEGGERFFSLFEKSLGSTVSPRLASSRATVVLFDSFVMVYCYLSRHSCRAN